MLIFCVIYIIINIQYKKWCLLIIPSCLLTWNYCIKYYSTGWSTTVQYLSVYTVFEYVCTTVSEYVCIRILYVLYSNMYVLNMYCIRICIVFEYLYVLYSNTVPVCTVFIRISVCTVIRICIVFEYVHTCTTKLQLL